MDRNRLRLSAAVVLAVGLGAVGSACARNDKLLLPIDPVMRSQVAQNLLAPDIPMKFGRATAKGVDTAGGASVEAVSATRTSSLSQPIKSDEEVCSDAFLQALTALQTRAQQAGAGAVVGIISNYHGMEMDSPTNYECRIGVWSAVVQLKGDFVRGAPPSHPAGTAPALPGAPTAVSDAPLPSK